MITGWELDRQCGGRISNKSTTRNTPLLLCLLLSDVCTWIILVGAMLTLKLLVNHQFQEVVASGSSWIKLTFSSPGVMLHFTFRFLLRAHTIQTN